MSAGGGEKRSATGEGTPSPKAPRKRLALFVLGLATFIALADTTIAGIALPSMRRELGFSAGDTQWILNGYALAFGGLLLLLGRVAEQARWVHAEKLAELDGEPAFSPG